MRKCFLIINAVVLFAGVWAWLDAAWSAPLSGVARVTELDRNEVFNEAKLHEYSPELAENLRYNVALWIQESTHRLAVGCAQGLAGLAAANMVVLILLGRRKVESDRQ